MNSFLDDVPRIDWSNFEESRDIAEGVLLKLAADKPLLRQLLLAVPNQPDLMDKCECHPLDDKIVIYDAMNDRGFRIRFRLASSHQDERPHTHRFSFSSIILRGLYRQTFYRTSQSLDESLDVGMIQPVCYREDCVGAVMTIHHSTIHSTIAPPDTVSLLIRGPAEKRKAIIAHKMTGAIEWRVGEEDESAERRAEVKMSREAISEWFEKLIECGVV